MIFGHNTNVTAGAVKYHVQTENAGGPTALIDTVVYGSGRVLHRRTSNYVDLLPLSDEREAVLKQRLDDQHRQVVEEIRSGVLHLPAPVPIITGSGAAGASKNSANAMQVPSVAEPTRPGLRLELLNSKNWLAGKQASLNLRIADSAGSAVAGVKVRVYIMGAAETLASVESGENGEVVLKFEMPRISDAADTLVIAGAKGAASGQISFQLRAKQRVPAS
jgi:hypothetical protein